MYSDMTFAAEKNSTLDNGDIDQVSVSAAPLPLQNEHIQVGARGASWSRQDH